MSTEQNAEREDGQQRVDVKRELGRGGLAARLLEFEHRLGEHVHTDADVELLRADVDTIAEARAEIERLRRALLRHAESWELEGFDENARIARQQAKAP